ncbi:M61 family metallopeptidase [Thalassotalea sediminis]|uniref:M61 family metallopeptidase n=1 Tax=Thalassotalea sediminis TaxID=1759089 RepID=UPI0025747302|nr:PDZ domain-containing protein [Thalassotalea sediminis]
MKKFLILSFAMLSNACLAKGETLYQVSFDNAVHHEARISATFTGVENQVLEVQMSRASPGRYAMHEFIKNVYKVSAVNSVGQPLTVKRVNPYQWHIEDHDGEVTLSYTLFGDRADGTYSQIDRTHAHLNMPATFAWATGHEDRAIRVEFTPFNPRWKVATQLVKEDGENYVFTAPNLAYFLDSPVELSDHQVRSWQVTSNGQTQTINLAVHHNGTDEDLDKYTDMAKAVVSEQIKVFGELPTFDYGEYTFIACYLPHVKGDGMEHRNSTILTNSTSLDEAEFGQLGTLSHEFFHAWNVERIRPAELEPFNFIGANMTSNLWLAEGFTTYYDKLMIKRANEWDETKFLEHLSSIVNQAYYQRGRLYLSPEGASQMATFVDAGVSVDRTNYRNNYFSYYTYGRAMGLALDLKIRTLFPGKSLDNYMRQLWLDFGKSETPYTRDDARLTLGKVTGDQAFADKFFADHVYGQVKVDFDALLASAGLQVKQKDEESAFLGKVTFNFIGKDAMVNNTILVNSPLYKAGVEYGDQIVKLGRRTIRSQELWQKALDQFKPGETTTIEYIQRGETVKQPITFIADPAVEVSVIDDELTDQQINFKTAWLGEDKTSQDDNIENER